MDNSGQYMTIWILNWSKLCLKNACYKIWITKCSKSIKRNRLTCYLKT